MADMRSRFTRGWWFLAPGLLLMTLIVSVPLFMALRYSVHRVFLYRFDEQVFVGLANYLRAFRDPLYINALKITTLFTLGCLVLSIVLGLLVAFMLSSRQVRMRPTWLALFLIPFVVTPVVAGIAWRFFMWQQEFGVINQVLGALGGPDPYWLLERETALIAAIISNSWHLTPLAILVFYAALTTIPDELYDAGKTDGASPMQSLWYIVLPMLRPHMLFVSIIIITSAFREFDMIWSLTGGGPGRATTVLSIFAYDRGIANQDMGWATPSPSQCSSSWLSRPGSTSPCTAASWSTRNDLAPDQAPVAGSAAARRSRPVAHLLDPSAGDAACGLVQLDGALSLAARPPAASRVHHRELRRGVHAGRLLVLLPELAHHLVGGGGHHPRGLRADGLRPFQDLGAREVGGVVRGARDAVHSVRGVGPAPVSCSTSTWAWRITGRPPACASRDSHSVRHLDADRVLRGRPGGARAGRNHRRLHTVEPVLGRGRCRWCAPVSSRSRSSSS